MCTWSIWKERKKERKKEEEDDEEKAIVLEYSAIAMKSKVFCEKKEDDVSMSVKELCAVLILLCHDKHEPGVLNKPDHLIKKYNEWK